MDDDRNDGLGLGRAAHRPKKPLPPTSRRSSKRTIPRSSRRRSATSPEPRDDRGRSRGRRYAGYALQGAEQGWRSTAERPSGRDESAGTEDPRRRVRRLIRKEARGSYRETSRPKPSLRAKRSSPDSGSAVSRMTEASRMQFTAENSFLLQPLCNFLLLITTMLFVVRDRMGGVRWRCRRLRYGGLDGKEFPRRGIRQR